MTPAEQAALDQLDAEYREVDPLGAFRAVAVMATVGFLSWVVVVATIVRLM